MTDLKSPTLIKAKGLLFLLTGCLAAALLLLEHPSLKVLALLALAVWCFCRFYCSSIQRNSHLQAAAAIQRCSASRRF